MMAAAVHLISLHTRALSLSLHPLPPLYNHQHRKKLINQSRIGELQTCYRLSLVSLLSLSCILLVEKSLGCQWRYFGITTCSASCERGLCTYTWAWITGHGKISWKWSVESWGWICHILFNSSFLPHPSGSLSPENMLMLCCLTSCSFSLIQLTLKKNIQLLQGFWKLDGRKELTGGCVFTKKASAYPGIF